MSSLSIKELLSRHLCASLSACLFVCVKGSLLVRASVCQFAFVSAGLFISFLPVSLSFCRCFMDRLFLKEKPQIFFALIKESSYIPQLVDIISRYH